MILPDSRHCQFSSKHAHFKRQEQTLFSWHRPLNLDLESSCGEGCIGAGHGQNGTMSVGDECQSPLVRALYRPDVLPDKTALSALWVFQVP